MIRDISASFALEGLDAPVDACLAFVRSTYGGVDHYHLALGHGGALLAVYAVRAFRGETFVMDPIPGSKGAPREVVDGAIERFAPVFAALYFGRRVHAIDADGRGVECCCTTDGRLVEGDGRAYVRVALFDDDDSIAFMDRLRVIRVARAAYRAA